ncbi:hypothetical protein N7486_009724 [Penicillium sp. IBT 16267x]|nr:hypothetical protein N7486_009724 [Penicillium sp. IBT 16267x]
MSLRLWRRCSVVREVLFYSSFGIFSYIQRLVLPFTREEPDDLERCRQSPSSTEKEDQIILPGEPADPVPYESHFDEILGHGFTSLIARMRPGVVLKCPRYSWWHTEVSNVHPFVEDINRSFEVEERILDILGAHPRVTRFIGISEDPRGLLFREASDGNLQAYIDRHNDNIDISLRLKWYFQAAEAIHYIHQKGVIHSDLRPENFLLHSDSKSKLDLLLCDFGGSTSGGIDGGHLPDSGFFNPCRPWVSTEEVDIFSLGSVSYTIMTGHWPYKTPGPFKSVTEKSDYEQMVDDLFTSQKYPPIDGLPGGTVIQGCWTERYSDMRALIQDEAFLSMTERAPPTPR